MATSRNYSVTTLVTGSRPWRKLTLPEGEFAAYLFDCDGTIADSMPVHYAAWKDALDEWNCEFPQELFYALGGMPEREVVAILNEKRHVKMNPEAVCTRKSEIYSGLISRVKPVPEVMEHILLQSGRIPFAVVSGSTRASVEKSLVALGLLDKFDVLICAGDYRKSKPDPEPFLLAAERLGVDPRRCLVFEDSELGIEAATAAGMASVKVSPPWQEM